MSEEKRLKAGKETIQVVAALPLSNSLRRTAVVGLGMSKTAYGWLARTTTKKAAKEVAAAAWKAMRLPNRISPEIRELFHGFQILVTFVAKVVFGV